MNKKAILPLLLLLMPILYFAGSGGLLHSEQEKQLKKIDDDFSGNLGVYIKDLGNGTTTKYNADRLWYLASTIKIPTAIAILQKVEEGELSLDDKLTLDESDLVDGAGELIWQQPGTSYTIRELLERMIRDSDSIAADMLIRGLGETILNEHIRERIVSDGMGHITTILQVRYDAYGELHDNAANLTNMDIIKIRITPLQERLDEFMRKATVPDENELKVKSIPDAYERYYERGLNSAKPEAIALMLERLAEGEYLSDVHTNFLLDIMKGITTGDRRIKAGLPKETPFAQKTGTQIGRAANVGIVYPVNGRKPIVVVAFAEKYEQLQEAELAFEMLGRLISEK